MSLIALIATSVSAYAVSSRIFAPRAWSRAWESSSIPVISGIRWSAAINATGSSRRASLVSTTSASAPEVAPTHSIGPVLTDRSRVSPPPRIVVDFRIAGLASSYSLVPPAERGGDSHSVPLGRVRLPHRRPGAGTKLAALHDGCRSVHFRSFLGARAHPDRPAPPAGPPTSSFLLATGVAHAGSDPGATGREAGRAVGFSHPYLAHARPRLASGPWPRLPSGLAPAHRRPADPTFTLRSPLSSSACAVDAESRMSRPARLGAGWPVSLTAAPSLR